MIKLEPFVAKGESKITVDDVIEVLESINAAGDFDLARLSLMQKDLEEIRFWHRHFAHARGRKPSERKARARDISKTAGKLVKLLSGDLGDAFRNDWKTQIRNWPGYDLPALTEPSDDVPDLFRIVSGLEHLKTVADVAARQNYPSYHGDGGLLGFMIREHLEPIYEKHFDRKPTKTNYTRDDNNDRRGTFPAFAEAVCGKLQILSDQGTVPAVKTIIGVMS